MTENWQLEALNELVGQVTLKCEVKRRSVVSNSLQPHGLLHGILQARILEWVAFPFSRGSSQPRDRTQAALLEDSLPAEPQGGPLYNWSAN